MGISRVCWGVPRAPSLDAAAVTAAITGHFMGVGEGVKARVDPLGSFIDAVDLLVVGGGVVT